MITAITNQDKIKYLKRYVLLDREANNKLNMISKLQKHIEAVPDNSIYEEFDKLVDEINNCIDRIVDIRSCIEAVADDRERLLLQYRYIDGKTFKCIGAIFNYSHAHIHRMHRIALRSVVIPEGGVDFERSNTEKSEYK